MPAQAVEVAGALAGGWRRGVTVKPRSMHLTIVIPVYGRHGVLARVLDRLERQDAPSDSFEVVVVADPADPDPASLDAAVGRRPFALRKLTADAPGVSAARNAGTAEASAPLLFFLGADMLPEPRLVSEHLAWHDRYEEEEVAILGHVEWSSEIPLTPFMDFLSRGIQFNYDSLSGIDAGWGRFYACNCSLKRSLFERSGGFDERFRFGYEELDVACTLRDLGMRLLYNREAVTGHLASIHPPSAAGESACEPWRAPSASS